MTNCGKHNRLYDNDISGINCPECELNGKRRMKKYQIKSSGGFLYNIFVYEDAKDSFMSMMEWSDKEWKRWSKEVKG